MFGFFFTKWTLRWLYILGSFVPIVLDLTWRERISNLALTWPVWDEAASTDQEAPVGDLHVVRELPQSRRVAAQHPLPSLGGRGGGGGGPGLGQQQQQQEQHQKPARHAGTTVEQSMGVTYRIFQYMVARSCWSWWCLLASTQWKKKLSLTEVTLPQGVLKILACETPCIQAKFDTYEISIQLCRNRKKKKCVVIFNHFFEQWEWSSAQWMFSYLSWGRFYQNQTLVIINKLLYYLVRYEKCQVTNLPKNRGWMHLLLALVGPKRKKMTLQLHYSKVCLLRHLREMQNVDVLAGLTYHPSKMTKLLLYSEF